MRLDRRDFGKLLVTGATGVIAGCSGGQSGVSADDLEGRTLSVITQVSASGVQVNPYAINQRGTSVMAHLDQLVLPAIAPTGERLTSDHTWTVDDSEVSVPCAVADYEIDPPDGHTLTFDDRLTYWSGDPLNARAYYLDDRVRYLMSWAFDEDRSFRGELVSETEYRRTFPNGRNRFEIERQLFPGRPPLPPTFTEPYHEELQDASAESDLDDIFSDISAEEVTFRTLAEEGYGTGAFEIESTDDIYNNSLVARARDDHPADLAVSNLLVNFATGVESGPAIQQSYQSGDVSVGEAIIGGEGADLNRDSISDDITQIGSYPTPRNGGRQLLFDWRNEHVRKLWVRRAILAATPLERALQNVWGETWTAPTHHTGLLSRVDEATLGRDAVSGYQSYPVERDTDTASEWLGRAGYERRDGVWHGPDGTPVSLRVLTSRGSSTESTLGETVTNGLSSFGFQVERRRLRQEGYASAVRDGNFELAFGFVPSGWSPVRQYGQDLSIERGTLWGSPLSIAGNSLETCEEDPDAISMPATVTLPEDPGALTIEGASYDDGGGTYRHDGGVDVSICEAADRLSDPEADEEALRDAVETCARWYNYAVPNFVFAQPRVGLIGNTAAFSFPEGGSRATTVTRNWSGRPEGYHVQAGTIR